MKKVLFDLKSVWSDEVKARFASEFEGYHENFVIFIEETISAWMPLRDKVFWFCEILVFLCGLFLILTDSAEVGSGRQFYLGIGYLGVIFPLVMIPYVYFLLPKIYPRKLRKLKERTKAAFLKSLEADEVEYSFSEKEFRFLNYRVQKDQFIGSFEGESFKGYVFRISFLAIKMRPLILIVPKDYEKKYKDMMEENGVTFEPKNEFTSMSL